VYAPPLKPAFSTTWIFEFAIGLIWPDFSVARACSFPASAILSRVISILRSAVRLMEILIDLNIILFIMIPIIPIINTVMKAEPS